MFYITIKASRSFSVNFINHCYYIRCTWVCKYKQFIMADVIMKLNIASQLIMNLFSFCSNGTEIRKTFTMNYLFRVVVYEPKKSEKKADVCDILR